MYRLVVTVESDDGPAVRGIDNRLARPVGRYGTEQEALRELERMTSRCAWDGEPMMTTIRGHHHTEDGIDVTDAAGAARVHQARADAEHGTPCIVCGAPIVGRRGHDAGCAAVAA